MIPFSVVKRWKAEWEREDSSMLRVGGPERFDFLASLSQWRRDGRLERIREDSSMLRSCELGRDESIVLVLSMVIGWDSWGESDR